MKHVLKTFGPIPEFSGAAAEKVHQVRRLRAGGRQGFVCSQALCLDSEVPRS